MRRMPNRRALLTLASAGLLPPARAAGRVSDDVWRDARRGRDVRVRIRLPSADSFAVVLYSHGLGGNREGGDLWGDAWTAAGVAVVHLQHTGSDSALWRQGGGALRQAASAEQLAARVEDVRFAFDELLRRHAAGESHWRGLRSDAIGMAGHSFGAHTAQALAGQRFPLATSWTESRIRAFIALSPSPGRGGFSVAESFGAITRPFFVLTGSLDADPFGAYADGSPRATVYDGLPPGQRARLWLDGADHMTFGGNSDPRGAALLRRHAAAAQHEATHQAIVARLSTLWWLARLTGDRSALEQFRQRPGVNAPDRLDID